MRRSSRILVLGSLLVAGLAAASTLYAQGAKHSEGSMMGSGLTGQGRMGGMMGMMGQMSGMMDHCNQMMQGMMDKDGSDKPNEQWRQEPPATPKKDG